MSCMSFYFIKILPFHNEANENSLIDTLLVCIVESLHANPNINPAPALKPLANVESFD